MIVRRSVEIIATSQHPALRECSPVEKEQFFDRTASTPCPNFHRSHRWNSIRGSDRRSMRASWDLEWEDVLGPDDQYTIPEAIVLIARTRGWLW